MPRPIRTDETPMDPPVTREPETVTASKTAASSAQDATAEAAEGQGHAGPGSRPRSRHRHDELLAQSFFQRGPQGSAHGPGLRQQRRLHGGGQRPAVLLRQLQLAARVRVLIAATAHEEHGRRAWMTVNAIHKGGEKRGGGGYGKPEDKSIYRKGGHKGGAARKTRSRG